MASGQEGRGEMTGKRSLASKRWHRKCKCGAQPTWLMCCKGILSSATCALHSVRDMQSVPLGVSSWVVSCGSCKGGCMCKKPEIFSNDDISKRAGKSPRGTFVRQNLSQKLDHHYSNCDSCLNLTHTLINVTNDQIVPRGKNVKTACPIRAVAA